MGEGEIHPGGASRPADQIDPDPPERECLAPRADAGAMEIPRDAAVLDRREAGAVKGPLENGEREASLAPEIGFAKLRGFGAFIRRKDEGGEMNVLAVGGAEDETGCDLCGILCSFGPSLFSTRGVYRSSSEGDSGDSTEKLTLRVWPLPFGVLSWLCGEAGSMEYDLSRRDEKEDGVGRVTFTLGSGRGGVRGVMGGEVVDGVTDMVQMGNLEKDMISYI